MCDYSVTLALFLRAFFIVLFRLLISTLILKNAAVN